MPSRPFPCRDRPPATAVPRPARRTAITRALVLLLGPSLAHARPITDADAARWVAAAVAMRSLAESWGDQPYGAVLVQDGRIIGHGPSRVVKNRDPDAHAEREALRDAIARRGPEGARGAVLYSTARPCAACERAAASAGVARMVFGDALVDAGAPTMR